MFEVHGMMAKILIWTMISVRPSSSSPVPTKKADSLASRFWDIPQIAHLGDIIPSKGRQSGTSGSRHRVPLSRVATSVSIHRPTSSGLPGKKQEADLTEMMFGITTALDLCRDQTLGQCVSHYTAGSALIGYAVLMLVVLHTGGKVAGTFVDKWGLAIGRDLLDAVVMAIAVSHPGLPYFTT